MILKNIDLEGDYLEAVLEMSIQKYDFKTFKMLLDKGMDTNTGVDGCPLILNLCTQRQLNYMFIEEVLKTGIDVNTLIDNIGNGYIFESILWQLHKSTNYATFIGLFQMFFNYGLDVSLFDIFYLLDFKSECMTKKMRKGIIEVIKERQVSVYGDYMAKCEAEKYNL